MPVNVWHCTSLIFTMLKSKLNNMATWEFFSISISGGVSVNKSKMEQLWIKAGLKNRLVGGVILKRKWSVLDTLEWKWQRMEHWKQNWVVSKGAKVVGALKNGMLPGKAKTCSLNNITWMWGMGYKAVLRRVDWLEMKCLKTIWWGLIEKRDICGKKCGWENSRVYWNILDMLCNQVWKKSAEELQTISSHSI